MSGMRFSTSLYLGVAVVTLILIGRLLFFDPVSVELETSKDKLFVGETDPLELSIVERNRIGWKIPFRNPSLNYICDSGEDIVVISFNSDSTKLFIRAKDRPGVVIMSIVTEVSVFPLYIEIPILAPFARLVDRRAQSTRQILKSFRKRLNANDTNST